MNDEQIADVLVEAEILFPSPFAKCYALYRGGKDLCTADAIKDWRTAGACLERMSLDDLLSLVSYKEGDDDVVSVGWLQSPRAICEAFAKAHTETSST